MSHICTSMDAGFRILLAKSRHQEDYSRYEEDDEDADDVDQHPLCILVTVFLVAPDGLLQVSHECGCPSQHQDSGAEILNKGLDIDNLNFYWLLLILK